MRKKVILSLITVLALLSCSPRDVLTRRLAADLISASDIFRVPQSYSLQTGVVSNQGVVSPESLVLQQRGWISSTRVSCPPGLIPPPCSDILLTPLGVDAVRAVLPAEDTTKASFAIPVARRELVSVTGISKEGNVADVEFTWRWIPLNEIGAALYSSDLHYKSTVAFRDYDDGWRVVLSASHSAQSLDDALKNAEPAP